MPHACQRFWNCYTTPHVLLTFDKVHNPLRLPRQTTHQRPKVARTCGVLSIFTSKCASRNKQRALFEHHWTSHLPRVLRCWCVLHILTSKCASRHDGVHFFDISTSNSVLYLVCFVHFDFEMCFAPQWCTLFRHLNSQKCSEPSVFCTFWHWNLNGFRRRFRRRSGRL